jgi:hypothetical protein
MWGQRMKIFKKKGASFQPAPFLESQENLTNPGRGFYEIHTFVLGEIWDLDNLKWCVTEEETIALVLFDIGCCQNRELTEAELEAVRSVLQAFSDLKLDMVVRVTYDRVGRGLISEPYSSITVKKHIVQLGAVLRDFSHRILVIQGVFVGSYGEMHDSKFLDDKTLGVLGQMLYEATHCVIAVRTPRQYEVLKEWVPKRYLAFYNDGMFGSPFDLGTYVSLKDRSQQKERLPYGIHGGEIAWGEDGLDSEAIIARMEEFHLTYLNHAHDKRRLEEMKHMPGKGKWDTLYDYIQTHLGYRLFVSRVEGTGKKQQLHLSVTVDNSGFGSFHQAVKLYVEIETQTGEEKKQQIPIDFVSIEGGGSESLSIEIENPVPGRYYLTMYRKWDDYPIAFANGDRVFLGSLL